MKKPYLDQTDREILRLNRENKIYTPWWLASYELKVACRNFRRAVARILIKNQWIFWVAWIMGIIALVLILGA